MPGALLRLAVLSLLLPAACAPASSDPIPAPVQAQAGCYELLFGPWLTPAGAMLDSARWDAPDFLPPAIVRLDPQETTVPVGGHFRLVPQPPAGSLFRSASWRATTDSIILEWSIDGAFGNPMFFVALRREALGYHGQAYTESDVRQPRPYRRVIGRRTRCDRLSTAAPAKRLEVAA
jgi:hypothetical protein